MHGLNNAQLPLTVGILVFDQVEVLDVAGPFEVFTVTRLNKELRQEESSPFRVLLVSENMDQVSAVGGLRFSPDVTHDNCPELDLLIVPGGWGTRTQVKNANLLKWIANKSRRTRLTGSVCTGSSLLGEAGLLDGRQARHIGVLLISSDGLPPKLTYVKICELLWTGLYSLPQASPQESIWLCI